LRSTGIYLAVLGVITLLMSIALVASDLLGKDRHSRPQPAGYLVAVVAAIGAGQAVLLLAAALVLLRAEITGGERAVLVLTSVLTIGLWLLGFWHLKRHPSQQQTTSKGPGKTAV
jgi:hypothetical protein